VGEHAPVGGDEHPELELMLGVRRYCGLRDEFAAGPHRRRVAERRRRLVRLPRVLYGALLDRSTCASRRMVLGRRKEK